MATPPPDIAAKLAILRQQAAERVKQDAEYRQQADRQYTPVLQPNPNWMPKKAKGGQISQDAMQLAVMNKKPAHLAIGGQGPRNWMKGVEGVIDPLKTNSKAAENLEEMRRVYPPEALAAMSEETRASVDRAFPHLEKQVAINNWIDRNLNNYIRKQMASPDDPIRTYADKRHAEIEAKHAKDLERAQKITERAEAEADPRKKENLIRQSVQMRNEADHERTMAMDHILHMANDQIGTGQYLANGMEEPERHRQRHGGERLGKSDAAKAWEDATDVSLGKTTVGDVLRMGQTSAGKHHVEPWMEKADPSTEMFHPTDNMHAHYLGFDHIVDILKQDLDEGRITPEQLNKVSIEQAVRRTAEYNQERTKKMQEATLKRDEGLPVHKDYGDGNKWIEIAMDKELPEGWVKNPNGTFTGPDGKTSIHHPNRDKLEDALKYEGDTMGHCVGGYTDKVMRGESRIFSLRDRKNEPHVTIEVGKGQPRTSYEEMNAIYRQADDEANQKNFDTHHKRDHFYQERVKELQNALLDKKTEEMPPAIKQIYGKSNKKPKKDYIPFVQDFVKGGDWSEVRTIDNADLRDTHDWIASDTQDAYKKHGIEMPRFATDDEIDQIHNQYMKVAEPQNYKAPQPIKKAEGGNVQLSVEQMRQQLMSAGKSLPDISQIGAQEAPSMPVKSFVIPANGAQGPMPMGGIDMSPMQPGQQMLPANAMQPNPLMPQQPQPPAGPAPMGGGSNILQMTPQGQKMAALAGSPQGNLPQGPKMAMGGSVPMPVNNHPFQASSDRPMPFMAKDGGSDNAPMNNNYSDNGATDFSIDNIQQLAKGGQAKKPLHYEPSPSLSKAEINAMAERMVRQMSGLDNPNNKTLQQLAREQNLPIGIKGSKKMDVPVINYEDLKGSYSVGVPGDTSRGGVKPTRGGSMESPKAGEYLHSIGGEKLDQPVGLFGGKDYGAFGHPAGWASDLGASAGMFNVVKKLAEENPERDVYGHYHKMSPEALNHAVHMLDAVISHHKPHASPAERIAMLNDLMRNQKTTTSKHDVPYPEFPGFENPADIMLQGQLNSGMRKKIIGLLGKEKYFPGGKQKLDDIIYAISHPELRNIETGAGGSAIIKFDPSRNLKESLSPHPTYGHDIPSKLAGRTRYLTPAELLAPRSMANAKKEIKAMGKKVVPFNQAKMNIIREPIDEQYINQMGEYEMAMKKRLGYKKGGVVNEAKVTDNLDTMRLALTRNKKAK